MRYEDLWVFYEQTGEDIQKDIIRQLQDILKTMSEKVRKEVLKYAPDEVKPLFASKVKPSSGMSYDQLMNNLKNIGRR